MAVTFAVRGDDLNARYTETQKEPGKIGVFDPPEVNTDKPGINGSTSIDQAGSTLTQRALLYVGRETTPSDRPRSILQRVNFTSISTGAQGLCSVGAVTRNQYNFLGMHIDTAGEITATVSNDVGQTDSGITASSGIGDNTWYDIVVTWDGTTDADGLKVYVDGVEKLSDTMIRNLNDPYTANDQLLCANINIGQMWNFTNSYFHLDEFVIFDTVIDPTSVTLTSGTGSLNGASRTAYVEVDQYEGSAASGGGSKAGLGLPGIRS